MLYEMAGLGPSDLYFWTCKSETITNFMAEKKVWKKYLTKEYKFSQMFLEKFEDSKVDLSIATKESLSTEGPFALQRPDIYLFLAISKCAVARIPTFLLSSNI